MSARFIYPSLAAAALLSTYAVNYFVLSGTFTGDGDENTTLNPAGWAFSIWGLIYIWQAVWVCYSFYVTCKSHNDAVYLSGPFWIWFIASCVSNIVWCLFARADILIATGIAFIFLNATLYGTVFVSHKYLLQSLPLALQRFEATGDRNILDEFPSNLIQSRPETLINNNNNNEVNTSSFEKKNNILTGSYVIVLNGLMLYSGWVTIAFFVNWAIIFKVSFGLSNDAATLLSGAFATVWLGVYFYLDLVKLRFYLSKSYTFYVPLVVAFVGILANFGVSADVPSSILTLILLVVTIVCFVVKCVLNCCCRSASESRAPRLNSV